MVTTSAPRFEHLREARGIGVAKPRLSWTNLGPAGWEQRAAEIEITRGDRVTTTGRVATGESVLVAWPGEPLRSREVASVRVRVWGATRAETDTAEVADWGPAATVEAGLLSASDWVAKPIAADWDEDPDSDTRRPPLLRRDFTVGAGLESARLYVTAHGVYEAEINGRRVGDEALAPGWTSYANRLRTATHDVTALLHPGDNAIGSWMGDGWYRGRLGWRGGFRNLFGSDLSLIAQLELRYHDGRVETLATDEHWRASVGPIISSGNYDGEHYDAREERTGWSSPGFDASAWTGVRIGTRDPSTFVAPEGPPVRAVEEVAPIAVLTSPSGRRILDLGQNLVGRLRIRLSGTAGATVVIRTAEVMQAGEIYTRPLREAKATDSYTLAGRPIPPNGGAAEVWEPRFTIHGFRYAEISGWPGDLDAAVANGDLVARVYHSDLERTGWFESSDERVNRLHENVLWSMRGNFVDLPTDCPQRDERVGWTGDLQVFARTASFLYDVSGMLGSWLRDVAVEQHEDGTVPWYVPFIPDDGQWTPNRPGAVWGDVAVLTPWVLYERFGDLGVLAAQYDSAKRWVDLVHRLSGPDHLWNEGFQLGDWLDPAAPPDRPAESLTDRYLVATAYSAWSTAHLAKTAAVLGRSDDAEHYADLAEATRRAFLAEYVGEDGVMTSDAQTAYSLAIAFELLPDAEAVDRAGERLSALVAGAGNRIATGFVGTPIVSDALTSSGHLDRAYDLLLEDECPSWLYAVEQGATTIWERWDSMLPDGTVNPGQMTSFNHYALGAVADWLHRVVAGIAPAAPGYRSILFRPRPGGGLTHASAVHLTPYGRASITWTIVAGALQVEVEVPTGTSAVVDLPGAEPASVTSGTHRFAVGVDAQPSTTGATDPFTGIEPARATL
ncbi:glycoside hydrolase family 78 protein [Plantibacter sp. VKM Ac-2880]|uniref:glycoside hydrolase family 78 protein n=1 Tax=Plantibacter sp. VKM Ac-2880 TaxID=2783827 RepID=UPI001890035F|nr:glycoside hydrolase family 78 protein [Plantibacter sp. VKM Ac-2880]MBF4570646.1 glycoside hydrolase family 78 protein [Plantibacter sp. VKM Ac-2880]